MCIYSYVLIDASCNPKTMYNVFEVGRTCIKWYWLTCYKKSCRDSGMLNLRVFLCTSQGMEKIKEYSLYWVSLHVSGVMNGFKLNLTLKGPIPKVLSKFY
jgi:hypothetical protein